MPSFREYGPLKDEMIRDRLIVGLKNQKLSEKLQMNASLTLENAAQQARQSKSVKKLQKQEVIQSGLLPTTSDVDQMEFNEKKKNPESRNCQ